MRSKLHLATACLVLTLPAFAQLDSSALRAKFGPPMNRENFHMPAGFDLIVDYGSSTQVCKLEVPALMPRDPSEKVSSTADLKRRMDDFLADLVPVSVRGQKIGGNFSQIGAIARSTTDYENLTVVELEHANEPDGRNSTITIRFKYAGCPTP